MVKHIPNIILVHENDCFETYIIIILVINNLTNRFLLEGQLIEVEWTIAPAIILIFIAIPSLRLLYLIDEINNPVVTLKTIGHEIFARLNKTVQI